MTPYIEDLCRVLGPSSAAWITLVGYLRVHYAMNELWDGSNELKFRRGGKTLVTLYINEGHFTVLLIYGKAERAVFEEQISAFPDDLRRLYEESRTYHDGKWMFLNVYDETLLPGLIRMLTIKKKPNRKKEDLRGALVGCCGNRCDQCLLYRENGGIENRQKFAHGDHKCYHRADEPMTDYSEMNCGGCHADCAVVQCAKEQGYDTCADCDRPMCVVDANNFTIPGRCNLGLTAEDITQFVLPYCGKERFASQKEK